MTWHTCCWYLLRAPVETEHWRYLLSSRLCAAVSDPWLSALRHLLLHQAVCWLQESVQYIGLAPKASGPRCLTSWSLVRWEGDHPCLDYLWREYVTYLMISTTRNCITRRLLSPTHPLHCPIQNSKATRNQSTSFPRNLFNSAKWAYKSRKRATTLWVKQAKYQKLITRRNGQIK